MARKKSTKAVATEVAVNAEVVGKPVEAGETFSLDGAVTTALAHKPAENLNADLPTKWIDPNHVNIEDDTRTIPAVNQADLDRDLAINLFLYGQKQPAIVVEDPTTEGHYVAVTGRTRTRAIRLIREGFEAVDPRTNETVRFHDADRLLWVAVDHERTKEDSFVADLVTQIKVNALTPVQEAYAIKRLTEKYDWSLTDAAKLFGYNNTNRQAKLLKLLELEAEVIDRVHEGQLSLDAAVSTAGLKAEKRLKLISESTGNDGKVDPVKLRGLLRDVYSKGNEEVKASLDAQYGYSTEPKVQETPAKEKGETESEKEAPTKKGKATADEPRFVKRNVSDLKKFIAEQVEDDATPQPVRALFEKLSKWFNGEVGDRSLWNTIEDTIKQK